MIKNTYVKPAIEVEVLAFEQGFALSTDFVVPGGGNNNGEDDEWV